MQKVAKLYFMYFFFFFFCFLKLRPRWQFSQKSQVFNMFETVIEVNPGYPMHLTTVLGLGIRVRISVRDLD